MGAELSFIHKLKEAQLDRSLGNVKYFTCESHTVL